jgi:hypothetical protein
MAKSSWPHLIGTESSPSGAILLTSFHQLDTLRKCWFSEFSQRAKRELGENPRLPGSGKRERFHDTHWPFQAGKLWIVGARRKPKGSQARRPASMWLWRDNRSRIDPEASREVSRSELVRSSILTSVLGSRPTLPHGFSVTRGGLSRYEIHSRVRRISAGFFSSRSCAKVDPCAQPMTEGEVHARRTCRKNQPPRSPARHHSDPRRRPTNRLTTIRDSIRTGK